MQHRLVIALATAMLASHTWAGTMGPVSPAEGWTWVGSVSAGPVWTSHNGETETFYLASEIEKTYVPRKSNKALASGELFLGGQKSLSAQWLGQLGIAAAITGDAKLEGIIWDDTFAQFDNLSYKYKVNNSRVAVKGKLLLDKDCWAMPWLSASLGVGFNRAHAFTNTPLIFEAIPNANFTSHTKTALTYTLGAGVQKYISNHWQLGLGYEFADWGRSKLGRAAGQTLNTGLALDHLYTNGVLLNLTFVA